MGLGGQGGLRVESGRVLIDIAAREKWLNAEIDKAACSVIPLLQKHLPSNEDLAREIGELVFRFQYKITQRADIEHRRVISNTEDLDALLADLNQLSDRWNSLIPIQRVTLMDNLGGDDRAERLKSELQNMEAAVRKTIAEFRSATPKPQRPPRDDTVLLFSIWDVLKRLGIKRKAAARFMADLLPALNLPARSAPAIDQALRNRES